MSCQKMCHSLCLVRRHSEQWTLLSGSQYAKMYLGTHGKTLEKPPPEKITCSQALSGSATVEPGFICVAPTDVTYGHVALSVLVSILRNYLNTPYRKIWIENGARICSTIDWYICDKILSRSCDKSSSNQTYERNQGKYHHFRQHHHLRCYRIHLCPLGPAEEVVRCILDICATRYTFAYSLHCRFKNFKLPDTSSCPYERETTWGGFMIPQDSIPDR